MKRPVWLAAGVAIGVGGTLWAEQRARRELRRVVARFSPEQVAAAAVGTVRQAGGRVRDAVDAGRAERVVREAELRAEFGLSDPPQRPPVPVGAWGSRAGRR